VQKSTTRLFLLVVGVLVEGTFYISNYKLVLMQ
jgi:hypothetical protein